MTQQVSGSEILDRLCRVQWDGYGWIHRPESGQASGLPISTDILIVFVHGFMSGGRVWKRYPGQLLAAWGLDVTYYQYQYPSWFYQNADVTTASTNLRDRLSLNFGNFAHIIFITHSTGALVVKHMLLAEAKELDECRGQASELDRKSVATRIRVVINLAGAHFGGRRYAPAFLRIYDWTWAYLAKAVGKVAPQFGYYKMGLQLMPIEANPWLLELDRNFTELMERTATHQVPLHITYDINAENEAVVRRYTPDQPMGVPFQSGRGFHRANIGGATRFRYEVGRAVHFVKSILRMFGADMHMFLVPQIAAWKARGQSSNLALSIAFDQLRTANAMDLKEGISELLSDPDASLDQQRLRKRLLDRVSGNTGITVIVRGPGGAGKSSVLRAVTREIARDWLSDAAGVNEAPRPMPLIINLKRLRLDGATRRAYSQSRSPADLWHAILAAWLNVAESFRSRYPAGISHEESHGAELSVHWLKDLVANSPTVIIFDSIDEFLNGHPDLTLEDIAHLCTYLTGPETITQHPRSVILAISHGEHNIWNAESLAAEAFQLSRLSQMKTRQLITEGDDPSTLNVLQRMPDAALDAIALPLIVFALPNLTSVDPRRLESATGLLELALERIVSGNRGEQAQTGAQNVAEWSSTTLEQRLDMLTVIAWAFASDPRGPYMPLERAEIVKYLQQGQQSWLSLGLEKQGDFIAARLLNAYRFLLKSEENLSACLRSTVFEQYWRIQFDHKQWVDLCIGRFVYLCFRYRNYKPLSARAFHPTIYERASEYMLGQSAFGNPTSVTRSDIDAMLNLIAVESPDQSQFVIGNLAATLNRAPIAIDGDALQMIVERLADIPDLARHVMMATLGFRAANGLPDDPSALAIRNVLFPEYLNRLADGSTKFDVNPATASLAWCYSRLIERRSNLAATSSQSWPSPQAEHFEPIVRMAFPRGEAYVRSLLFGYLQSIELLPANRDRAITAVHYLLFAAVGTRAHLPAGDGFGKLEVMFGRSMKDQTKLGDLFREYTEVPEVHALYELSRQIYFSIAWKQ